MTDLIARSRVRALMHNVDQLFVEVLVPEANGEAELLEIERAERNLKAIGGRGGTARARAEGAILNLVQHFDDTREAGLGPWPVSRYMAGREGRADRYRAALQDLVDCHDIGTAEAFTAKLFQARRLLEADR